MIYIYMLSVYQNMSVVCQINCVGRITCSPRACSKFFLAVKPVTPVLFISYMMDEKEAEKSVHLEMRNLKLTELLRLKNRGKKG